MSLGMCPWCGRAISACRCAKGRPGVMNPAQSVTDDAVEALKLILAEPYGCPMCDSGKLRDPQKEHWPECGYPRARAVVERAASR